MEDRMKFEVLADGTLKITTDEVSPENHVNAEATLKLIGSTLAGPMRRDARGDVAHHHTHSHGDVTHSH